MFRRIITTSNLNRRVIIQFIEGNKEWKKRRFHPDFSHHFYKHFYQVSIGILKETPKEKAKIGILCLTDNPEYIQEAKDIHSRLLSIIKQATKDRKSNHAI